MFRGGRPISWKYIIGIATPFARKEKSRCIKFHRFGSSGKEDIDPDEKTNERTDRETDGQTDEMH